MMLDGGTLKGRRILSKMSVAVMTENHTLGIKSAITQSRHIKDWAGAWLAIRWRTSR
jgi:hypothetical protein